MSFETVDFSEYNKPPFLPGWMTKEETLQLAKTPDKQLEELCVAVKTLSEQYNKDFFRNNTEFLNRRGRLLGIERQGSDDSTYYEQQELRILLNLNNSSVPKIIQILKSFYNSEIIHIEPDYPAGIKIIHDGHSPEGIDFNSIIKETISAGISFETRELYIYKELMGLSDSKLTLKYWNLDEVHYRGQLSYNELVTYGEQNWEKMLYNGRDKYCRRDKNNGLRRIRIEFFTLKSRYSPEQVMKDSAGLVDVVNLQHLYYNYFDSTEDYNDSIMYGPEITPIID